MGLKTILRDRITGGGFCVAAIYVLVVAVVFAYTAFTTKPDNVGLDWIPFILLSTPWYQTSPRLLFPGLVVNAGLMYLLGAALDTLWRRIVGE